MLGQKKFAEAEPLLLKGYEGMKQRKGAIPALAKVCLTQALNLDIDNISLSVGKTARTVVARLRDSGLEYDRRRRLISRRGRKELALPFRYVGADDRAGPNYTGQPAVASYYEYRSGGRLSALKGFPRK